MGLISVEKTIITQHCSPSLQSLSVYGWIIILFFDYSNQTSVLLTGPTWPLGDLIEKLNENKAHMLLSKCYLKYLSRRLYFWITGFHRAPSDLCFTKGSCKKQETLEVESI